MSHGVHLLVTAGADASAGAAAASLTAAGHAIVGTDAVAGSRSALQSAIRAAASAKGCQLVLVLGGCSIGAGQGAPDAIDALTTSAIPGFAQIARLVTYRERGSAAVRSRACASVVGSAVALALPSDADLTSTLLDEVVLPELDAFVAAITGESMPAPTPTDDDVEDAVVEDVDEPVLPPPNPSWTLAASGGIAVESAPIDSDEAEVEDGVPASGWKRALYDLEGELMRGKTPDVPQNIEGLAPVMNVLHQAGEYSMMKLPNGNKVMLYGFPDLQRPSSKVILVGWGEPLAEVIALHRYPRQAGLAIDEARGMMPGRDADVASISEAITGRAPSDPSGQLFAVDHSSVFIQRGNKVYRWDGKREREEGTPNQALATLVISWHQR
ncbi:MAG: molybdopterin-binding protein [Myxococcota bacterium]